MKLPLDHVGYYSNDLAGLAQQFRSLGFEVIGPVALETASSGRGKSGKQQSSAHIMLHNAYIELTSLSVHDSRIAAPHHLDEIALLPAAIRLLLLECTDANDKNRQLRAQGISATDVHEASRQLAHRPADIAHFRWFGLPEGFLPGTLSGYVQQLSRDLVFDPACVNHSNSAVKIHALYHAEGARLDILQPLQGGSTSLLADSEPGEGFITGLGITVNELDCFRDCLDASGVQFRTVNNGIRVAADAAGGAFLHVEQAA